MTSYVLVFYFANKYTDRHNKYICVFGAFTYCKKSVHCLRAEPAFGVYLRLFACGISNNLLGALIGLKVCAKSWLGEGACTSRSINAQICTYKHTYRDISMYVFVSFFFLFAFLGLPNIFTQMPRIVRQRKTSHNYGAVAAGVAVAFADRPSSRCERSLTTLH